jgi:hypothetical protein
MRVATGGGLDGTALADMGGGLRVIAASPPEDHGAGQEDVGEEAADYRLTRHTKLQAGSEVLLVGTYSTVIAAFRANVPDGAAVRSPAG